MRLAEAGVLGLDDSIGEYLPWPSIMHEPSIRQLLNHTGSVPDYGALPEYQEAVRLRPESPWTTEQFLDRTLSQGVIQGWRYSNIGYMLLRQVIDRDSTDELVIVHGNGISVDAPVFHDRADALLGKFRSMDGVVEPQSVMSYYDLISNPATKDAASALILDRCNGLGALTSGAWIVRMTIHSLSQHIVL